MGKRLIIQRRGRGTPAHRVASHRFKDKIRYRSYDALEKKKVVLKESLLILYMTQQELLQLQK